MNRIVSTSLRTLLTALCLFTFSLLYVGCGGSDEAMVEDEMVTDTGVTEEQPTEEQPAEEQPKEVTEQPSAPTEGPTREQLQQDLDNLKTENIQLKEQLAAAEQSNRGMMAKVSDLEAANIAMKQQAEQMRSQPKPSMDQRPAIAVKSSSEEIRAYETAVSQFNRKDYTGAINEFQTLLNSGAKDDYADNCHYWIGESYFQIKDYRTAIEHFRQVMNYRFSEKRDDAQLMIAQCYERSGERDKAMAEYKKLVEMYPTSEYVKRARAKLR